MRIGSSGAGAPQTLVATGSTPSYIFGGSAAYQAAASGKVDLISVHEYDGGTGVSGWGLDAANTARALNNPWYAGEDGFCCGGGDTGSKAGNAAKLQAEYQAYLAQPEGAGMLYWALVQDPSHD